MDEHWTLDANRITDSSTIDRLKQVIDDESALIIEHRFYRGAQAPHRFVCDSGDDLEEYLRTRTRPGDSFYVWAFETCCSESNVLATGKVPEAEGRMPKGGAY